MSFLNYHHLRYFRTIAREGSLTAAAARLHVSQSALSIQLRTLEDRLGHPLFERNGRRLRLTEAGRIALEYAEAIFRAGDELVSTLAGRSPGTRPVLRVGAVATLSRNFQLALLRPVLRRTDVEVVVRSGTFRELLAGLDAHAVDIVLSNLPVPRDADRPRYSHLLDRQPVSLVGRPRRGRARFRFPDDLRSVPVVLPSVESSIRQAFDGLVERAGIRPRVLAEVDDMAMLRLVARESEGLTLVPSVVVRDELRSRALVEWARIPQIEETFYAITASRRFPNPLVRELIVRPGAGPES